MRMRAICSCTIAMACVSSNVQRSVPTGSSREHASAMPYRISVKCSTASLVTRPLAADRQRDGRHQPTTAHSPSASSASSTSGRFMPAGNGLLPPHEIMRGS
jgi:hypothetical protein